MENNRTGKGQWEAFLQCKFKNVVREGLTEKVIFEQRLEGGKGSLIGRRIFQAVRTGRAKAWRWEHAWYVQGKRGVQWPDNSEEKNSSSTGGEGEIGGMHRAL